MNTYRLGFGVVFVAGVFACGEEGAVGGGTHTGGCEDTACPGTERWAQNLEVNVHGDATIGPFGRIFVTAGLSKNKTEVASRLLAYEPDGTKAWEKDLAGPALLGWPSRPVVSADGVYVAASDRLFKYDFDGEVEYQAIAPDGPTFGVNLALLAPPPAVGLDGTVYWQFLAATHPDGSLSWRTFVDPRTRCESPVPVRPDRVLVRVGDSVTAYDHMGERVWSVDSPQGLRNDDGCSMIPLADGTVATTWCEESYSVFACGHIVRFDVETGEVVSHTAPPKPVPITSSLIVDTDGTFVMFSIGPEGNPEYRSKMWRVDSAGQVVGEAIVLPWFGVYGAALGDDGLFYVSTEVGAAALTGSGEIVWTYEPPELAGLNAGAPAIGANGCVYYESVRPLPAFEFERKLVCLESTATGLANTCWPRTSGGNDSALHGK